MRKQLNIIGKYGLAWLGSLNGKTVEKGRELTSNCFQLSFPIQQLNSSQFICITIVGT